VKDPVLELFRRILIDKALDQNDWEWLKRLSQDGWERHVVSTQAGDEDLYWFLEQDEHFLEKRIVDWMGKKTYYNYRYRDEIDGVSYYGEIRVPLFGGGGVESRFYPRGGLGHKECTYPKWFASLIDKTKHIIYAGQQRSRT
jgi:hypothetical protein